MNVNTSLVTDTSVAVTEQSVDAYRDQISKHIQNDLSGHTSVQLHLTGYFESSGDLAADATLRMLLTTSAGVTGAWAFPALVQPGTFPTTSSAPIILRQPDSVTAPAGSTATFTVYVASVNAVNYQWQKHTVDIPSATSATLTLLNVQATDVESYRCVITNIVGAVTSNAATLTLGAVPAAVIVTQPVDQSVKGSTLPAWPSDNYVPVTFTLVATGGVLSYQWQVLSTDDGPNWGNLDPNKASGATSPSLTLMTGSLGGLPATTYGVFRYLSKVSFRCIVSNASGATISNVVKVIVT